MATQPRATGRCNTSLGGRTVPYLEQTCHSLGLPVTPTGAHGRTIKEDYIAAIYVNAMDFSDIIEDTQHEIRKFIAWLIKQKVPEITAIARDSFHIEAGSRKKGEICEKILEVLLEDPELPAIQGFNSGPGSDAAAASQESTSHEPPQAELTGGQTLDTLQKMLDLVDWVQNGNLAQSQPLIAALANAATKPAASNPAAGGKKAGNKEGHFVHKKSTADTSGGPPPSQHRASAQRIRQIAAAMRKDPASVILLIPALEQVADEICKE